MQFFDISTFKSRLTPGSPWFVHEAGGSQVGWAHERQRTCCVPISEKPSHQEKRRAGPAPDPASVSPATAGPHPTFDADAPEKPFEIPPQPATDAELDAQPMGRCPICRHDSCKWQKYAEVQEWEYVVQVPPLSGLRLGQFFRL